MALDLTTMHRECPGWGHPCGVSIPISRQFCYFCTRTRDLSGVAQKHRPELVADIIGRVPLCICGGDPFEDEHLLTEGHIRYTEGVNPRHRPQKRLGR